jgi:predicted GNAT superfamily acetyltransferase
MAGRGDEPARRATDHPAMVRIEIPQDIFRIQSESAACAVQWRVSTRAAFQWALAHGYDVERFVLDVPASRTFYLLARTGVPSSRR